jgi:hypothetical protein
MGWAVSRILFPHTQTMIIYLGYRSPGTSCNLPGNIRRAAFKRFPIWSCTRWGLPCLPCHHGSGELLPRHFNLTCVRPKADHRRCCFCGTFPRLPGVRVTNHRALWCSDFPPRPRAGAIMRPPQSVIAVRRCPCWPVCRPWRFSNGECDVCPSSAGGQADGLP